MAPLTLINLYSCTKERLCRKRQMSNPRNPAKSIVSCRYSVLFLIYYLLKTGLHNCFSWTLFHQTTIQFVFLNIKTGILVLFREMFRFALSFYRLWITTTSTQHKRQTLEQNIWTGILRNTYMKDTIHTICKLYCQIKWPGV